MSAVGIALSSLATTAIIGGVGAGIYYGTGRFGEDDAEAAKKAADAQLPFNDAQAQANKMAEIKQQKALSPYAQAGRNALEEQQALAGALGPEAQAQAIQALQSSPEFASYVQQGEEAILANASATGGLRGGNTQAALAQFRPQLLNQLIEQKLGRLGGLTAAGQNAAMGQVGALGQTNANRINIYGDAGAITAGGILGEQAGRSTGRAQAANLALNTAGTIGGLAAGGI